MKTIHTILLLTGLATGLTLPAADAPSGAAPTPTPAAPAVTNPTSTGQPSPALATAPPAPDAGAATAGTNNSAAEGTNGATAAIAATNEPPVVVENGVNGLRMNFRGAPLNLVLEHLAEAAGFIIHKTTEVRGTMEVWSKGPVTKDEAVELLYTTLKKNGYALTRKDRILTIVALDSAKTADLEITTPYNPEDIAAGDEVITAIIHIHYASAAQLMANLEILLPTTATLTANESANTLILVATKSDIKRMLKIINALDSSIASVSSIKVMPLKYADAKETATMITQLFSPQGSTQNVPGGGRGNLFSMFAGFGGQGGRGSRGGSSSGSSGASGAAAAHVVAVADDRSNSIIVSAPEDLLATISEMVDKIDQEVTDATEVRVFRLVNADPAETADQLMQLFPDPTGTTSGTQNNQPFFFGGRFGRGGGGGRGTTANGGDQSERTKKLGKVMAVPDPRTGSLIVTASKSLMPQIDELITALDSDKGKRETVGYYELQNADPQDVAVNLQELFNRNNVRMNNNSSRGIMGNNNPLTQRETQTQNGYSTSGSRTSGATRGGSSPSGGNGF